MSPLKIAVDAREMTGPLAGKGRYLYEVVKALAKLDFVNDYLLYTKIPLPGQWPKNFRNVIIGGLPGLRQFWLANDVANRGCDLLWAPTGYLPVVLSKVPTVVTVHDLAVFVSPSARPALKTRIAERLLLRLAIHKAAKVITVSASTKRDLIGLFAVPDAKIHVSLLGVDHEIYRDDTSTDDDSILRKYQLEPGYLLFIGTLEPRKNIEGLMRAYARTKTDRPLVIGGQKGWYYQSIFTAVRELRLTSRVHFLGRVPDADLPALYRQAYAFLFPSFYEGFGLPVLEALACGTPVICSNVSSLPEIVGQAGLLIDPSQPKAIAGALQNILDDRTLYTRLKKASVAEAAAFTWQKTAAATLNVFKNSWQNSVRNETGENDV